MCEDLGRWAEKEVVYLSKTSMSDIDNDVARQVKTQMDIIDKKYPMISIDPYNDPRLMLKSNMTAARNYNADVMDYRDGMQRYYGRVIKDRLMSERYKRIDFSLMAKGRKACSSLNIEMSIKGDGKHVYSAGSRELKKVNTMWSLKRMRLTEVLNFMHIFQMRQRNMSMVNGC